ncbi:hypothetical protein LTR37_002715 [Vermiconidia calcicola]|uniref:Uncharacterized protein n=1 Tax=Vermiconidia calcicola TaxID=1690605 RepID=A0ACC3NRZ5_9PEZI|nr:hypothetical protein LTR37_002715 [Vermiconidia calcicola]
MPSYSGISTNLKTLKANLFLSAKVATVGIGCPIGLSFVLQGLLNITPLQAFAAGAALCSTSLGTTFTVLSTSGLTESRLGVVLSSAAMLDDVVGLVMVQVISNLGGGSSSFDAVTVVRPILVSIAFAVVLPLVCLWIVKPITAYWFRKHKSASEGSSATAVPHRGVLFVVHTAVLLAMVTGSTYAGTSNLFSAYLAGVAVTWWSNICHELERERPRRSDEPNTDQMAEGKERKNAGNATGQSSQAAASQSPSTAAGENRQVKTFNTPDSDSSGIAIYERYYEPAVQLILKPFFFASIGFSIPITQMFAGAVVLRGFVTTTVRTDVQEVLAGQCFIVLAIVKEEAIQGSEDNSNGANYKRHTNGRYNDTPVV